MSVTDVLKILRPVQTPPRYGSVLLPLGTALEAEQLIRAAVVLANQLSSRLIGMACATVEGLVAPTAEERQAAQVLMEASGERFEEFTREVRAGRRWYGCDAPLFEALRAHAWSADLILLAGARLRGRGAHAELRKMMRFTAAPVMIWPEGVEPRLLSRAAVLCDEAPASLRAVRSAAPVLSRCSTVTLVGAGRHTGDLKRGLEARGVPRVRVVRLEPTSSDAAARRLLDLPADLIVVGGWPEPLGGWPRRSVTDLLLEEPRAPLLLTT